MSSYIRRLSGRSKTLTWLLGIAGGVFLIQIVLYVVFSTAENTAQEASNFMHYFQLPTSFSEFLYQPWSLLTYWLAHPLQYFFPFIMNCLFIFMFGGILVSLIGETKMRSFILFSLLVNGVLTFLISSTIIPDVSAYTDPSDFLIYHNTHAYGMASLMAAIITATITIAPKYPVKMFFLGNVAIVWIGAIVLILRYFSFSTLQNTPELIALTLGALTGAGHILLLRRGKDITEWTLFPWKLFSRSKTRMKVVRSPAKKTIIPKRKSASQPINQTHEVDRILDKINDVGYEKLTRQEKEFLEKASKE